MLRAASVGKKAAPSAAGTPSATPFKDDRDLLVAVAWSGFAGDGARRRGLSGLGPGSGQMAETSIVDQVVEQLAAAGVESGPIV